MLLPFSLKVVWFCLSLSGLLGCWAAMVAFGHALGAYELPLLYCIGCTILEGSFCLGLIWRMDPFQMPRGFCIAQSMFIGFGSFLVTGAAASISISASLIVLKPKTRGDRGRSALAWRHQYLLLVLVFPLVAFAVQIAVIFHTRWPVQRADDFHCDYSGDLIWIRFLSYAGTPLLLSLPCFYLSVKSVIRLLEVHQPLRRARHMDIDTGLPPQPKHVYIPGTIPAPQHFNPPSSSRKPLRPTFDSPNQTAGKFHMSFSPSPLTLDSSNIDSVSSFPAFATSAEAGTVSIDPERSLTTENPSHLTENWRDMVTDGAQSLPKIPVKSHQWPEYNNFAFVSGKSVEPGTTTQEITRLTHILERNAQQQRPSLAPAMWRLILFQFAFTTIQLLSSITSLIAVITHRPPTSFGTQHIALILAGWGPLLVFSHLPSVRKTFSTWLPWNWRSV